MNNVKNSIGWADFTWNPVVGCKRGCPYCYARKIYKRFKPDEHKFTDIVFYPDRLIEPAKLKKPSRIFVGSMSDICYWQEWVTKDVIKVAIDNPRHTFMFLTKDGSVYKKYDFPNNCCLGVTYTDNWKFECKHENINNTRFISIEPLIKDIDLIGLVAFDWWIVGGLTPRPCHAKFMVDKIVENARALDKCIFIKDNLKYNKVIKEFPKF